MVKKVAKIILSLFYDIVYVAFTGIIFIVFNRMPQFHMHVPEEKDNVNTMYPYRESTFPEWLCGLVVYVPNIAIILVFQIRRRNFLHLLFSLLALAASATTWLMLCEMGKVYCGRPRPNAWSRIEATGNEKDSFKSFPSSHSACAFSGFLFMSLYIAGEMRVFSDRNQLWRMIPVVVPLMLALSIIITRVRDYYHNVSDVIGGSVIGIISTCLIYFCKFHTLTGPKSGDMKYSFDSHKDDDDDKVEKEEKENKDDKGKEEKKKKKDVKNEETQDLVIDNN